VLGVGSEFDEAAEVGYEGGGVGAYGSEWGGVSFEADKVRGGGEGGRTSALLSAA
jgi:hypothetical protein